jgi:hypothetical protein
VVLTTKPSESGYAGWVYTTQNTWRKFGLVSKDEDSVVVSADKIGIGTTNPSQELDVIGSVNITGVLTATTFGNINAGIVTGTSFAGDGSALTGVIGIGSGFVVQDSGSAVGTAATVNFADNLSVTFAAGVSTITGIGTENIRTNTNATFLKNVNVSGSTTTGSVIVGSGVTLSSDGDGFFTGVVTATSYAGDGSALTGMASTDNVRTGILDVAGISTFRNNALVGSGITLSPEGDGYYTGVITATKYEGDGSALTGIAKTGQILATSLTVGIAATIGIVSFSSAGIVTATSGIVTYYGDTSKAVDGRWNLTANGSSDYVFAGIGITAGIANDPALHLARGRVYEFVNEMGAHPFRIQLTANGSTGTQYPHGITNNDVSNGTLRFEIPMNAPNVLYYQCTSHAGMGGSMTIYPSI